MELDQFANLLATRVRARDDMTGGVFYLDLRARPFGNRAPMVIRERSAAGWPAKGAPYLAPPTKDTKAYERALAAAKVYVKRHYAPHLFALVHGSSGNPTVGNPTVAEACEGYIAKAIGRLGPKHNTVKNRASVLRKHLVGQFGPRALAAISVDEVETWLQGLMVDKAIGRGKKRRKPASMTTKRHVLQALWAVWKSQFPRIDCPFKRIELDDGSHRRSIREAIEAGREEELLRDDTGALTPEEVARALTAAMSYDRKLATDPRWRHIAVPNTAALIAFQVATGARIGELALLRWWMIYENLGLMLMPGTKSETSFRLIPIQDLLRPWIAELKALACADGGVFDRQAVIFPTDRRRADERPNKRNLQGKVAHALELAGLKIPQQLMDGKMTHWARATHISWASVEMERVEPFWLSIYVGHALSGRGAPGTVPFAAITLRYMSQRATEMPERHRTYIRHLPAPEAVREALASFEASPVRHWTETCRVRKPKAGEIQRQLERESNC